MHTEEWRPIAGYVGAYEVSDLGRVRSLDRKVFAGPSRERLSRGRVLSAYTGGRYSKVRLTVDTNGSTKNVHALVAAAFLGDCPPGLVVRHINGDPHDNRVENLCYGTESENMRDQVRHGTHTWAKRTHCHRGHPYSPENTRIRPGGARMCRTCNRFFWRRKSREEDAS